MTSSGGEWIAVPIPGEPDRWDWVPSEQPPSPDGSPGKWHVVGGSGEGVGKWAWFPAAGAPVPPPAAPVPGEQVTARGAESVTSPPMPWETTSEPTAWEQAGTTPWESATTTPGEVSAGGTAAPAGAGAAGPSPWQSAGVETPAQEVVVPPVTGGGWQAAPPVAGPKQRSWKLPLIIGAALLALVAAVGVVAPAVLSDNDRGKDKDAITALVNDVVTADNGSDVCSSRLTSDFVQNMFGSLETCEKDDEDSSTEDDATGATVSDITFDGDAATATVTVNGGDTDGSTGTWGFAKDDTDTWRVAEWRADYLRSTFQKAFAEHYQADGTDDPFADADLRGCVTKQALELDDPGFLDFAHQQFRDSDEGTKQMLGFMAECPSDTEGVSALRALFEKGFRQNISAQLSDSVVDCIVSGLRTSLSDDDIKELSINSDQPHPDIQERVQQTTMGCAGSEESDSLSPTVPATPNLDDPGFGV